MLRHYEEKFYKHFDWTRELTKPYVFREKNYIWIDQFEYHYIHSGDQQRDHNLFDFGTFLQTTNRKLFIGDDIICGN